MKASTVLSIGIGGLVGSAFLLLGAVFGLWPLNWVTWIALAVGWGAACIGAAIAIVRHRGE